MPKSEHPEKKTDAGKTKQQLVDELKTLRLRLPIDNDLQMIEYTLAGDGRRLGLFVHHTDAEREYAYDRNSHVGTLDKALDRADAMGWIIVDMQKDWKTVFNK